MTRYLIAALDVAGAVLLIVAAFQLALWLGLAVAGGLAFLLAFLLEKPSRVSPRNRSP